MSNPKYLRGGFDFQLAHVVEECGEVLAAAGKTQRWGRASIDPTLLSDDPLFGETNEAWLIREMRDLFDAMARLANTMGHATPANVDSAEGQARAQLAAALAALGVAKEALKRALATVEGRTSDDMVKRRTVTEQGDEALAAIDAVLEGAP